MIKLTPSQEKLIHYLEALVRHEEVGRLAGLRRGVNKPPGLAPEAYSQVVPFLESDRLGWVEEVAYLVAVLFAMWHQGRGPRLVPMSGDLGRSFRDLASETGSESVEKRFVGLLKSRPAALPHRLRHAVGLLKTNDVPVNWRKLILDLQNWSHPDRFIQRRWARSFWAASSAASPGETTE